MGIWDLLGLLHMCFESWLENEIYYLFLELINFTNKNNSRKVQNWYLSHEKYSEDSESPGTNPIDILEHEKPNKLFGAHENIFWSIQ